jgi:hypothetical protein
MYDPHQPRIPKHHHGGGRWTRDGHGLLSDLGALWPPEPAADEEPRRNVSLPQYAFQQSFERERPDFGAWVGPPPAQTPTTGGAATGTGWSVVDWVARGLSAALAVGVARFEALSRRNDRDRQAVISFRAREFVTTKDDKGLIVVEEVRSLDRETVATKVCTRLNDVEELVDDAFEKTPQEAGQGGAAWGSRLHKALADGIDALTKPDKLPGNKKHLAGPSKIPLKAEASFVEGDPEARYGKKGSIRVDVLEYIGNGTVCIYDLKTGDAVLDPVRMFKIAKKAFEAYGVNVQRIIVTQVRRKADRLKENAR